MNIKIYRKYCQWLFCDDWLKLEKRAGSSRLGLRAGDNLVAPWEWRAEQRSLGGNADIRGGEGIYHENVKSTLQIQIPSL